MSTANPLQRAIDHLVIALDLLTKHGAFLTAAHVDGALACLRVEARPLSLNFGPELDFTQLDRLADQVYAT